MVKPAQKRAAVRLMQSHKVSERRACGELGVSRSMMVYVPRQPDKDATLMEAVKAMSAKYPRFGYRRIAIMLGWECGKTVNPKRIYRIWKRLNLQLPRKRPRRKRPGTSQVLLRPEHHNHVWSYDFVSDRTAEGRKLKILVVLDEHTRECLALEVASSIRAHHVIDTLGRLMTLHGRPKFIRSDNGPEFTANALIRWLTDHDIGPSFINPGSPWQNAYVESFNGKFRDECLNREWFLNRKDAQLLIEKWRYHYNHERPHSSLENQPPAKVSGRKKAA